MVVVTELPRPNLENPDSWASLSVVHQKWLRQVAPQLGLDAKKAIVGDAVSSIIGDDTNCFPPEAAGFHPEWSETGKRHLEIRLNYEIDTPELPDTIRQRLRKVKKQITALDWKDEKQYGKAKDLWQRDAKHFTQRQVALNGEIREALRYFNDEVAKKISGPWQEFIYGKKVL